jgi:cytochrome c-type biogenesis protein CcmH/NrfG
MSRAGSFVHAPFEMHPMKRLRPLLILSALLLSFASCKSESRPDAASAPGATPAASGPNNGAASAEATPPPGAVEVSEATFRKELEQNPDDPVARYNLGTIYLANGKFAEAAEEFKVVTAKEPQNVEAFAKMGIAYASANKLKEAVDAFKGALKLQPKNAELHRRLAEVYEQYGMTAEAERLRAEFKRLEPNARAKELYQAGKYEDALGELRKGSRRDAESFYVEGLALLKLQQPGEAASVLRQAARMKPNYADTFFQLGNAHDQLNQQEEAAAAFKEAARLSPNDADALYNLGNTYDKLNRPRDAAAAFAAAVRVRPSDAGARFMLASAQLKQGNVAAANEQYEALKSLSPETAEKLQRLITLSSPPQK